MKDLEQCEQEVLAAVGKLLISQLEGRDDLARAIFDTLTPQFSRYPYLKILTHTVLGQIPERDETKEELIARIWGRDKPIKTADDHRAALREIDGLMAAKIDTPEGNRLDILATLVEAYESNTIITEGQLVNREDWQEYGAAMRTIATAFGTTVDCHQKNNRLAVDFRCNELNHEQSAALSVVEQLVELVSEFPIGYLEQMEPPGQ